jgi:hypothetical protein
MGIHIEILRKLFRKILKSKENRQTVGKYIEKDTECDLCENKNNCIENGNLVFASLDLDSREHYIKGIGCVCRKQTKNFDKYMISQVIENAEQNRDILKCDDGIDIVKRFYEKHGDMTFGDMMVILRTEGI